MQFGFYRVLLISGIFHLWKGERGIGLQPIVSGNKPFKWTEILYCICSQVGGDKIPLVYRADNYAFRFI